MEKHIHILVTGASGFIGRALLHRLLERGHQVTALIRKGAEAPEGCAVLSHDLGSDTPLSLPLGIDAIAHLAQSRAYRAFPGDADEMFRVNVMGTHKLLSAGAEAKVSRFCLVSTGTVYDPFTVPMVEDARLSPDSNLGATKLAAEVLAKPYSALFLVSTLRLFAPYGPGQTARIVPDLIRRVRDGIAVTLPETGGGMCFTPTYIDDVCDVVCASIEKSWAGTFNIASPETVTIQDAALTIGKALGNEPIFERRPGVAPILIPNVGKLSLHYDLSRFRSFADGIAATLAGGT